ncbi:hypothetical protein M9H77_08208 [Catharanthus roseus]|uniref:Uncharacterized protein n=1 Tax=Catharanthus roseus TaxID=4058 RepID=A0ACC0BX48_CATRO|nr:hypothetical protein M9H77_08208 [Catharanthus roseus]
MSHLRTVMRLLHLLSSRLALPIPSSRCAIYRAYELPLPFFVPHDWLLKKSFVLHGFFKSEKTRMREEEKKEGEEEEKEGKKRRKEGEEQVKEEEENSSEK